MYLVKSLYRSCPRLQWVNNPLETGDCYDNSHTVMCLSSTNSYYTSDKRTCLTDFVRAFDSKYQEYLDFFNMFLCTTCIVMSIACLYIQPHTSVLPVS